MGKIEIVEKKFTNNENLERYLREKVEEEKMRDMEYLLEKVRRCPNITEEMIEPRLRKYLGEAKREYKKEILETEQVKSR